MRVEEIRRLIKLVEESQIDELEVRRWWTKVRIQKASKNHRESGGDRGTIVVSAPPSHPVYAQHAHAPEPAPSAASSPPPSRAEGESETGLVPIRSPMVGTFYRAPSPQSPPYVDVGQRIDVGTVVCIVEAMKLMNEIESEVAGSVEKVLVQNGQPVEFNQTLFLVRPS